MLDNREITEKKKVTIGGVTILSILGILAVIFGIEGLSLDVFDLKKKYSKTRFIYSIHNYVPICVNGSYYMRHKHCNCNPNHTSKDCLLCTRADMRNDCSHETYLRGLLGNEQTALEESYWVKTLGFDRMDNDVEEEYILDFANTAIKKINENCDTILAVSKRVKEIAIENGFDESKTMLSYIGTKVAEISKPHHIFIDNCYPLKIVFLGNDLYYEEKGYPFLLEALSQLEPEYARKVELYLTVKQPAGAYIRDKLSQYYNVIIKNGYSHDDFEEIFNNASLSIVPVLWEDNLPQIAIESVAYGVPVLASSAGGAKELSGCLDFQFLCGDVDDFLSKIRRFIDNPSLASNYWKEHHGLTTLSMHAKELVDIYNIESRNNNLNLDSEQWSDLKQYIARYHNLIQGNNSIPITQISDADKEAFRQELLEKQAIIDDLSWRLSETRKSKSFKIGRMITAIPRKLRVNLDR